MNSNEKRTWRHEERVSFESTWTGHPFLPHRRCVEYALRPGRHPAGWMFHDPGADDICGTVPAHWPHWKLEAWFIHGAIEHGRIGGDDVLNRVIPALAEGRQWYVVSSEVLRLQAKRSKQEGQVAAAPAAAGLQRTRANDLRAKRSDREKDRERIEQVLEDKRERERDLSRLEALGWGLHLIVLATLCIVTGLLADAAPLASIKGYLPGSGPLEDLFPFVVAGLFLGTGAALGVALHGRLQGSALLQRVLLAALCGSAAVAAVALLPLRGVDGLPAPEDWAFTVGIFGMNVGVGCIFTRAVLDADVGRRVRREIRRLEAALHAIVVSISELTEDIWATEAAAVKILEDAARAKASIASYDEQVEAIQSREAGVAKAACAAARLHAAEVTAALAAAPDEAVSPDADSSAASNERRGSRPPLRLVAAVVAATLLGGLVGVLI